MCVHTAKLSVFHNIKQYYSQLAIWFTEKRNLGEIISHPRVYIHIYTYKDIVHVLRKSSENGTMK